MSSGTRVTTQDVPPASTRDKTRNRRSRKPHLCNSLVYTVPIAQSQRPVTDAWAIECSRTWQLHNRAKQRTRLGDSMSFSDDDVIEQIAAGQLGLVTRAQLRARGITAHAIAGRVQSRRLRPLHRGVYRVGPVVAPHARELAAVLACGPHAVVSHRSAGWLWQLLPDPGEVPVDITQRKGERGRRPNIRRHRVSLSAKDMTIRDVIPVTTPWRTVLDLAAVLDQRQLE